MTTRRTTGGLGWWSHRPGRLAAALGAALALTASGALALPVLADPFVGVVAYQTIIVDGQPECQKTTLKTHTHHPYVTTDSVVVLHIGPCADAGMPIDPYLITVGDLDD